MVLVAGYFQYTSVSQMRTDVKASIDAQITRSQAEIEAIRAQANTASVEAQATVMRELTNVRTEVQKRIDTEFKNENITKLVETAAKSKTEKEFGGIVQAETSKQVAKAISDQQPLIQRTVENQTKEAVKAFEPIINSSVARATEDQVSRSVVPIQDQIKVYADYVRMANLTTLGRGDDRNAFDYLVQVDHGNKPESASPELRRLAGATALAVITEKTSGLTIVRSFNQVHTPEAMKKLMIGTDRGAREAALDSYPQNDNTILPTLVQIVKSDQSITVLSKAVGRFNALTKQKFDFWLEQELLDWWDKNQKSFQ
jgi:hypothetical protein